MGAVLEAARLVARTFDGYIEGFAIRPAANAYVAVEPVGTLALPGDFDDTAVERSQALFESTMQRLGVPAAVNGGSTFSWSWRKEPADDTFLGSYGRVFDLIVLGRPGRDSDSPRMPPLESALFESGKLVLVVPTTVPKTIGRNVVVAWNGSVEQAHTNALAMGLLRLADTVTVLTVEGSMTPGPTGEQAATHMRRNGVKATAVTVSPGTRSAGEAILDQADKLGADLLVKGAYTQSRLRQLIFGGATRHILAHAKLPVLMAH